MITYLRNIFKRAILIPAMFAVACAVIAALVLPTLATPAETGSKNTFSEYTVLKYEDFANLEKATYVGKLSCQRIELETAVLYDDNESNAVCLKRGSTEPWHDGCVILTGENTEKKFKRLHAARVGDKFEFEPAGRSAYTYTITEIAANQEPGKVKSFSKPNRLIMCLPYRDFSGEEDATYYLVYVAEREG